MPTIFRPPDAPIAQRRPAGSAAATGQTFISARLPGPIELTRPGTGSNHMTPLLNSTPVDPDITRDPKADNKV